MVIDKDRKMILPNFIPNWVNGEEVPSVSKEWFDKYRPTDGRLLYQVARSRIQDVQAAVKNSLSAQSTWGEMPAVQRGLLLHKIVVAIQDHHNEIAEIVALETGKSFKDAYGETSGAITLGLFFASEGQRLYGHTTTSAVPNRYAMTFRQPIGLAGLIIAANTPIANIAWKVFPALICGNTAILKAAEDAPGTAWFFGQIAKNAGLPPSVLNIIQGYGVEAGQPLVAHPDVGVISFTGSTETGKIIQKLGGERFARISLEMGGKNPLVVCDDADLENAVKWILLSAFSNAGQRCASASRIIIYETIYNQLRDRLVKRIAQLKIGPSDDDDFGPVINAKQLNNMLAVVKRAKEQGAIILAGGNRLVDADHLNGFYMSATLIEGVDPRAEISQKELFGPIAILYRTKDFEEALKLANDSPYGLTACIHTRNLDRAIKFCERIETGVAIVNAGTFGSEPHMPFGGRKQSGNGTREPGVEALNVYSELKDVYINISPERI